MKRQVAVPGRVRDVERSLWEVRETRDTRHGFSLLFGFPVSRRGVEQTGPPRLIATRELVRFWDHNRIERRGLNFDLPAGRTTLKRLRRRLGFNYFDDLGEFWQDRMADLQNLSARDFAERHGVDISVVFDTRTKLLGRRSRQPDWWRKPRPLKILRSPMTLREMGERLSISISQAKRLRDRALNIK